MTPETFEVTEEIAAAIEKIAKGMEALSKSKLKKDTIILLVSKASGINLGDTRLVLEGLESLRKRFLK